MKRPARDYDQTFPSPATLPFVVGVVFYLKTGTVAFSGLDFSDEVRPAEIFKSDSHSLRLLLPFLHTPSSFFQLFDSLGLQCSCIDPHTRRCPSGNSHLSTVSPSLSKLDPLGCLRVNVSSAAISSIMTRLPDRHTF